jgi:hypothetical protein
LDVFLRDIPGVAGVVKDGILPGYFGYETGQAAVGDAFGRDAVYTADGGMTSLWASMALPSTRPSSYQSIFELGMLGTGIPSSIGAKLGAPARGAPAPPAVDPVGAGSASAGSAFVDSAFVDSASPDSASPDGDPDGDGWSTSAGDCDPARADVHPGAPEACDGVDQDCDGLADEVGAEALVHSPTKNEGATWTATVWPTGCAEALALIAVPASTIAECGVLDVQGDATFANAFYEDICAWLRGRTCSSWRFSS